MTPAVRMDRISKRFGAVQANDAVTLTVAAGSVHGIVGENGAGKSTLMAMLYGLLQPDSGAIAIDGRPVRIGAARQAMALGIGMVHQHFMLAESMSALDNILLGAEPHWRLGPARAAVRRRVDALMHESGLQVRLDRAVEELPVGERQRVEILKALVRGARLLILDEPTAVLTPPETDQLFATLRRLRDAGSTLLLISHKLKEIVGLCDAVTVMRGGRVVHDGAVADTSVDALAEAMVGRRVVTGRHKAIGRDPAAAPSKPDKPGAVRLAADRLCYRDASGVARLDGVSLTLRAGEIVGVAGVAGNGQSELLELLSGMRAPASGALQVGARCFAADRWLDPAVARALGVAHVPEDRQQCGLVLGFAAWECAVLGYQRLPRFSGWLGGMKRAAIRSHCAAMMADHDVRPPDPALPAASFSGGNQQKLVLAREALAPVLAPTVLLVGQPTRGVDIGAVEFIHQRLRAMRDAGGTVLLVSSDLDEILALADRVLVMAGGRIAGELAIADCSDMALGRLMAGQTAGPTTGQVAGQAASA